MESLERCGVVIGGLAPDTSQKATNPPFCLVGFARQLLGVLSAQLVYLNPQNALNLVVRRRCRNYPRGAIRMGIEPPTCYDRSDVTLAAIVATLHSHTVVLVNGLVYLTLLRPKHSVGQRHLLPLFWRGCR